MIVALLAVIFNFTPVQFLHKQEEIMEISSLGSCSEQKGTWHCDVSPKVSPRDYGHTIEQVPVRETKEVDRTLIRSETQSALKWIIFLPRRTMGSEILFPVGGLEQHYLEQLKFAQEKVSTIEQKLRQVREFYKKNKE